MDTAISPDEKSWFVVRGELSEEAPSAFAWNQWERDSLEVAEGDPAWQAEIRAFWDEHCPLLLSVKDGYQHVSVRKSDLQVVEGREPEYEEVSVIAPSFSEWIDQITDTDANSAGQG